jgi:putative YphP/YqiW family bacilliredoxin
LCSFFRKVYSEQVFNIKIGRFMYPDEIVAPMKKELTDIGFTSLESEAQAGEFMQSEGKKIIAINSVCGCAAGCFRPAVAEAVTGLDSEIALGTVFAGKDKEATNAARAALGDLPPSSPSLAFLDGNKVLFMLHRHEIEGQNPSVLATKIKEGIACLK